MAGFCLILGRRQVVSHLVLVQAILGSNPSAPAIFATRKWLEHLSVRAGEQVRPADAKNAVTCSPDPLIDISAVRRSVAFS